MYHANFEFYGLNLSNTTILTFPAHAHHYWHNIPLTEIHTTNTDRPEILSLYNLFDIIPPGRLPSNHLLYVFLYRKSASPYFFQRRGWFSNHYYRVFLSLFSPRIKGKKFLPVVLYHVVMPEDLISLSVVPFNIIWQKETSGWIKSDRNYPGLQIA